MFGSFFTKCENIDEYNMVWNCLLAKHLVHTMPTDTARRLSLVNVYAMELEGLKPVDDELAHNEKWLKDPSPERRLKLVNVLVYWWFISVCLQKKNEYSDAVLIKSPKWKYPVISIQRAIAISENAQESIYNLVLKDLSKHYNLS